MARPTLCIYGNGLICEKTGDIDRHHHYNHLGSAMKLTDAKGGVTASFTYGTYGELLNGSTGFTRFLYNGRCGVITDENGLYYMRQRYYSPELKRFVLELKSRLYRHNQKGKDFVDLILVEEFDYRYEAKGYEQVIKEMKTDGRVNVGKEFSNLDNSISPNVRPELYDEATTWAIYDMKEKGYLSEDGTLDIISEKEKQYNEEHSKETVKENACSKGK